MFRALNIASTGMTAQETNLEAISHNIANGNTVGFKKERIDFQDLLYQTVRQAGTPTGPTTTSPTGLQIGTGARVVATERIHTQGNPTKTDNPRDVSINGGGFFQVLMPDGTNAYTRDGSFQPDQNGQLVTANGYPLQPAITLPQDTTGLTIGRDGTVSVTQAGGGASVQIGQIQLATFMNPAGLESKGENLYVETGASGGANQTAPGQNGAGVLNQGYVESSNVNVVEELVNMIQTQRAYEINSKAVQTSDQMLARLAQL